MKGIAMLERDKGEKKIKSRDINYEMRLRNCDLTTLETRIVRGAQIEVFKILDCYKNININSFFLVKGDKMNRGHEITLPKKQCRLGTREFTFSQWPVN